MLDGFRIPYPPTQPIGLMTNVATQDQGSNNLEATETVLATLVSLALQQTQIVSDSIVPFPQRDLEFGLGTAHGPCLPRAVSK